MKLAAQNQVRPGFCQRPAFLSAAPKAAFGERALSAAAYWGEMTEGFFASAAYHQSEDPLERLLGYVDFRAEILQGDLPDYRCLLGTLVQETYATHPDIRAAGDKGMSTHISFITRDVEAAKRLYAPDAPWSAESVGYFIQAVLQGAFIFPKVQARPRGRAREPRAFAAIPGAYLQPAAQQQTKGKAMNDLHAKKFIALYLVPSVCDGGLGKNRPGNQEGR